MTAGRRLYGAYRFALLSIVVGAGGVVLACSDRGAASPTGVPGTSPDPRADLFAGLLTVRATMPGGVSRTVQAPLRATRDGRLDLGAMTDAAPSVAPPLFDRGGVPAAPGRRPVVPHGRIFHSSFTDREGHRVTVAQVFEPGNTDRPPFAIYLFREGKAQTAIFVRHERASGHWRMTGTTTLLLDSSANIRARVDAAVNGDGSVAVRSGGIGAGITQLAQGAHGLLMSAGRLALPDEARAQVEVCTAQKGVFLTSSFLLIGFAFEAGLDAGMCDMGNVLACVKLPSDALKVAAATITLAVASYELYKCLNPTPTTTTSGSTSTTTTGGSTSTNPDERDYSDPGIDQWIDGQLCHCNSDGTGCIQAQ